MSEKTKINCAGFLKAGAEATARVAIKRRKREAGGPAEELGLTFLAATTFAEMCTRLFGKNHSCEDPTEIELTRSRLDEEFKKYHQSAALDGASLKDVELLEAALLDELFNQRNNSEEKRASINATIEGHTVQGHVVGDTNLLLNLHLSLLKNIISATPLDADRAQAKALYLDTAARLWDGENVFEIEEGRDE